MASTGNPAWVKGVSANPRGRPKGVRNKFTTLAAERLRDKGFDPLDFLIGIAKDETCEKELRFRAAAELMKYRYRKLS